MTPLAIDTSGLYDYPFNLVRFECTEPISKMAILYKEKSVNITGLENNPEINNTDGKITFVTEGISHYVVSK